MSKRALVLIGSVCLILMLVLPLVTGCAPTPAPAPAPAPAPTPAPTPTAPEVVEWKIASAEFEGDPATFWCERFADAIEEWSDGKIKCHIYPYGTLGGSRDINEQVQMGTIQFAATDPCWISSLAPQAQLMYLHYLWPRERVGEVIAEVARNGKAMQLIEEEFRERDFVPLALNSEGWWQWTTNSGFIKTPEDYEGLKIRVMDSKLLIESHKAYGCTPIALPFGELYGALQTGLVDGQCNPAAATWHCKFYEVQKYCTQPYAVAHIVMPCANREFFDSLPEDTRNAVRKIWLDLMPVAMEYAQNLDDQAVQQVQELAPEIGFYYLTDEEIEAFRELALAVREKCWNTEIGGERAQEILEALVEDIETAKEKLGIE